MTAAEWFTTLAPVLGFIIGFAAYLAWDKHKQAQELKRSTELKRRIDKMKEDRDLVTFADNLDAWHENNQRLRRKFWGPEGTHYLPGLITLNNHDTHVEYIPKPDRTNTAEQFWNH